MGNTRQETVVTFEIHALPIKPNDEFDRQKHTAIIDNPFFFL